MQNFIVVFAVLMTALLFNQVLTLQLSGHLHGSYHQQLISVPCFAQVHMLLPSIELKLALCRFAIQLVTLASKLTIYSLLKLIFTIWFLYKSAHLSHQKMLSLKRCKLPNKSLCSFCSPTLRILFACLVSVIQILLTLQNLFNVALQNT